jgi:hypothetical protein
LSGIQPFDCLSSLYRKKPYRFLRLLSRINYLMAGTFKL